jgi:hypothetical protein
VYCHYFFYEQRPEDRVLQALVRKTKIIRQELGSLSEVLESQLAETLRQGIRHQDIEKLRRKIDEAQLNPEKRASAEEELESTRRRQIEVKDDIDRLRGRINDARKWIGFDTEALRDAVSCSLELLGADPLKPAEAPNGTPSRFAFPILEARHGADPTWAATMDVLRVLPKDGKHTFQWRKESPIRPVVFTAPDGIDEDIVQLHLQHRVVQRLLGRFISQGFVHYDLSRACLAQTSDAIPRVVLIGRLSLYGKGAVRLHEEILTVTARWIEPSVRKGALKPYGRDGEATTMDLLESALRPNIQGNVPEPVRQHLAASIQRDIEELLPHLTSRGGDAKADAENRLAERGKAESESMLKTLEEQKKRVAAEYGKAIPDQLFLEFDEQERRQLESNRRYWQRWLQNVEGDIQKEPARILDFYKVASSRIEPIGLAYLWPVTG